MMLPARAASTISGTAVKISSCSLCCNMVLSITGTAVLGVGAQMKTYGWFLTPAALFVGVLLTSEMTWLVATTSSKLEKEDETLEVIAYQDFAEAALGKTGMWAAAVSSVMALIGFIIGGIILESQNMQIVAPIPWEWPLGGGDDGRKWWVFLLSFTSVFYCFIDIGSILEKAGAIGVLLTVFVMTFVFSGTVSQISDIGDFNDACRHGINGASYQSSAINVGSATGFEAFLDLFSVASYVIFIFAIVVTLPTLRATMAHKEMVTPMSVIAFVIVGVLFTGIMLPYYWVFGNVGPSNVIEAMRTDRDTMSPGWWATIDPWSTGKPTWIAEVLSYAVTFHLLCSDAIYVPCTVVAIEKLLPVRIAARKSVWIGLRLFISFFRFLIGSMITDFVKMSNLTSAAFLTMNNMMLPILAFYAAGPKERAGSFRRAMHGVIFVFSLFVMVFGTINAVKAIVETKSKDAPGQFPRPGITAACFNDYCQLNASWGHDQWEASAAKCGLNTTWAGIVRYV